MEFRCGVTIGLHWVWPEYEYEPEEGDSIFDARTVEEFGEHFDGIDSEIGSELRNPLTSREFPSTWQDVYWDSDGFNRRSFEPGTAWVSDEYTLVQESIGDQYISTIAIAKSDPPISLPTWLTMTFEVRDEAMWGSLREDGELETGWNTVIADMHFLHNLCVDVIVTAPDEQSARESAIAEVRTACAGLENTDDVLTFPYWIHVASVAAEPNQLGEIADALPEQLHTPEAPVFVESTQSSRLAEKQARDASTWDANVEATTPALARRNRGVVIAGLICGILSLPMSIFPFLGFGPVIAGLVLSIFGLVQSPQRRGMSITGIVLSSIGFAFTVIILVSFLSYLAAQP